MQCFPYMQTAAADFERRGGEWAQSCLFRNYGCFISTSITHLFETIYETKSRTTVGL